MKRTKPNLLVVAHPDDETLFFSGLIQQIRNRPWHLICVTDGNGDGRGKARSLELQQAARRLKIQSFEQWNFQDRFKKRLLVKDLAAKLKPLKTQFHQVYTHGPLGEYGHPHHQDVSFAVHQTFLPEIPVWAIAYNARPELWIELTKKQFNLKTSLITDIYRLETERFLHLLPALAGEGFCQFSLKEVTALYRALIQRRSPTKKNLQHHQWLAKVFPKTAYIALKRPF